MSDYYYIVNHILSTKPEKISIQVYDHCNAIVNMLSVYLQNKCEFDIKTRQIGKCFEYDTFIDIEMKWPNK